jgi:hypothetical protein
MKKWMKNELYSKCCQQMLFSQNFEKKNRFITIYGGFFQHQSMLFGGEQSMFGLTHISWWVYWI